MKNRLLLLVCLVFATIGFAQKRKLPPVNYKSIHDTHFSIGDRINLGTIQVVLLPLGKDSLIIPDSLEAYRTFVQRNSLMTFKLHMIWKSQGVKYPGRTDRTRDALLEYLNEDGPDEDSTCYINYFKHAFVKQDSVLRIELEVIGLRFENMNPDQGKIANPGYNSILEYRFCILGTISQRTRYENGIEYS